MREFVALPDQETEQPSPYTAFVLATAAYGTLTLDQVLTSWLHAKSTRTESAKTERAYGDVIAKFRAVLQDAGLDLDASNLALISTLAQGWASKNMKTGGRVSPATFNQRLA